MVEKTSDIMFNKFLVVATGSPVNEESVFYLHFLGQKAFNFNTIVATVDLFLLEIRIHLVMTDLAI